MGFPSRRAARTERARLITQIATGRYGYDRSLTVRQWLDEWLERRIRDGLRPSTTVMYRRYVEQDLQPGLGHLRLNDLRHNHVDHFLQAQLAAGRGVVTVHRMHAVLSSALSTAHRLDLVESNAASNIGLPAERPQRKQVWEPKQVGQFLDSARTDRLAPLFEIAVFTGLRRGEPLGLQWPDVDLNRGELVVRRQRVDAGGRTVEGEAKTVAGQNRRVGLGPVAIEAFRTWEKTQEADRRAWRNQWRGGQWVFTREDGTPVLPQFVTKHFEQRGTAGDDLSWSTPSARIVAGRSRHRPRDHLQRLGHSSIAITNDLYSHLLKDANRQAGEAAESLVTRAANGPLGAPVHTSHTQRAMRLKQQEAPAEDFLF